MNTASVSPVDSAAAAAPATRRMVDAPTRVFHWLLALSFVGAYVTAEGERWRLVHITLGYTMIGLVGFRLIWLWLGPRSSRWSAWAARMRAVGNTWQATRAGQVRWSAWQAGLNTLALVGVLLMVVSTVATGYVVDQEWLGDWLEEVHEWAGNALLALVLVHVGLVLLGVWRKSGQPLQAMLTGRVQGRGPDLIDRNRVWLAALMLAAVGAFWWSQWQTAPSKLDAVPAATHVTASHDDDD